MSRAIDCAICGARFTATHSQHKYCSPECSREGERASWRAYGERNREKRREYYRTLYAQNPEKVIAKTKAYQKSEAGRAATKKAYTRQKQINPHKVAARQAVKAAIDGGRLTRGPCYQCGAAKVEAHHPDYSKPLQVIWACPTHHRQLHIKEKV